MKSAIQQWVLPLLVLVGNQLYGQVPGYLGKRLSVGYRLEAAPLGLNFFIGDYGKLTNSGRSTEWYDINMAHNLDVEFVVKKQLTLRCVYGTASNGAFSYSQQSNNGEEGGEPGFFAVNYPTLSSANDYALSPSGYSYIYNEGFKSYDYINYSTQMLKVGLCFAQGFYYAPHGHHLGLYFISNNSTVNYVFNDKETAFAKVSSYGLQFETTRRRMIKDMFILEYGYSFAYMFGSKVWSDEEPGDLGVYIASQENGRVLFQLVLGVRYMIPDFFTKKKK